MSSLTLGLPVADAFGAYPPRCARSIRCPRRGRKFRGSTGGDEVLTGDSSVRILECREAGFEERVQVVGPTAEELRVVRIWQDQELLGLDRLHDEVADELGS